MDLVSLVRLHNLYIKGSEEKAPVVIKTTLLCNLTKAVMKVLNVITPKIHVTTIMLKHLYDTKPAEEYEFILHNLISIVRYPEHIYENKSGKRGQFSFTKRVKDHLYFCSIETTQTTSPDGSVEEMNFVVTAFRVRKENYLKDYKLLWSWKGDFPSS